jgi:tRNA-dihydrouridine synthase
MSTTNLFLAPLQSITIAHYRNLYAEIFGGIDAYYSPFIATAPPYKSSPALFKDLLPEANTPGLVLVPQLLGNNGTDFRYFAHQIVDMGYTTINWNIGCPYPMITNKEKGSGILPYPRRIEAFLDEVCQDSTYDLSIKMRLGLYDLEEGVKVIQLLNNYPIKEIIIHGRTGAQKYTGHCDLDAFENLYLECHHQVTYNGDIFTLDDFNTLQKRFPKINNFMLGRGALRDPFLPAEIKGNIVSRPQKLTKIRAFHDGIYNYYKHLVSGDKHLCDKMKEFWQYTSAPLDPTGKYLKKIKKATKASIYLAVVEEMFEL